MLCKYYVGKVLRSKRKKLKIKKIMMRRKEKYGKKEGRKKIERKMRRK
jgi:hypothetical protein